MKPETIYASYPVFTALPQSLPSAEREVAAKEVSDLLEANAESVETRGIYSTSGFRADADIVMWWVAHSVDDLQDLYTQMRQTRLGRALQPREVFVGLVRPAEFTKDHQPAFVQKKEPKKYLCVYPFVRTPEWYLLSSETRGAMLRDHGIAGREFPEVLANTTSAFGIGDFEWILAFEADRLDRIVDLIRHLRATEARRYTKLEVPFFTGIRKPVDEIVAGLP
jgi:hydrogen peroxide-dependent heme synthase